LGTPFPVKNFLSIFKKLGSSMILLTLHSSVLGWFATRVRHWKAKVQVHRVTLGFLGKNKSDFLKKTEFLNRYQASAAIKPDTAGYCSCNKGIAVESKLELGWASVCQSWRVCSRLVGTGCKKRQGFN
jgi:hypothetical protein